MTVKVIFPDGTIRHVVSVLKLECDRFVQTPINCDPRWKYLRHSGHWVAARRKSQICAIPLADQGCWWDNIPQMKDDAVIVKHKREAQRSAA